jgi:hypothetical protein
MEDNVLIFVGTFWVIVFNIFVILFSSLIFKSELITIGIIFTIVFGIAAIYFDWLIIRYFINKIKQKIK